MIPGQLHVYVWADRKKPLVRNIAWDYDVVITTFSRLSAEWRAHKKRSVLMQVHWPRVVFDKEKKHTDWISIHGIRAFLGHLRLKWKRVGPDCYSYSGEHAETYNELVVNVRRNILMADWNDPSHVESLLNPKQWKFRSTLIRNVRLSCCVAGHINVTDAGEDIQETMDILVEMDDWNPDWQSTSSSKVSYLVEKLKDLQESYKLSFYIHWVQYIQGTSWKSV
ncbi:F-box protein [Artemisia annua]|uniref:F-box protein n=1 Tax=Artemisia annua TaxID=35608 RepID=A0A2U1MYX9_ARTAN|nr:F-box protein [Artemisia annua]